jgi:MraZ protein
VDENPTEPVAVPAVEPPRGLYPSKLDEKGRLKLPAAFLKYFNELKADKLFVTSLDRRIAQIYTIATWRVNERLLANFKDNPKAARNLAFTADWLGADSEIDGQGRVLFNTEVRKVLELDGKGLHIRVVKPGHVEVMTDEIAEARRREALETSDSDIEVLEMAGLQ